MKLTIFGSVMMLAGIIALAILMASSISLDWTNNGQHSFMWNLSQYGLTPVFYIFLIIAVIGLLLAVAGLFRKEK